MQRYKQDMIRSISILWILLVGIWHQAYAAVVENNVYVLMESKCAKTNCVRYGAFKFLKQPKEGEGIIKYEWVSMNHDAVTLSVEPQNFLFGTTEGHTEFGIGFRDHRLLWRATDKGGELYRAEWMPYGGTYCVSKISSVLKLDIKRQLNELRAKGACVNY